MSKEKRRGRADEAAMSDEQEAALHDVDAGEDVSLQEGVEELKSALAEANDKYIRLYADFENFRKIAARNREEALKYANEDLMSDLLTVIDHLELALQHASNDEANSSLAEGVQLTLKEMKNALEKHGLVSIDALGRSFDPAVHHAMSQIEDDKAEENTVVKEFRKGYLLKDKVLRPALVGVATKRAPGEKTTPEDSQEQ